MECFEQLLDQLNRFDVIDITSDIQVLETMMAREGLTDQPLKADEPEDGAPRLEL